MKRKLGEILIEQGAVRPEDVDAAIDQQSSGDPARIGDLLVSSGKVTPLQLAKALCVQSGLPFVQLDQVSPEVAALVPIALQREHCLVPFKEDGRGKAVHVAVADPTTHDVLAELEFQVGRTLRISIAARDEIEAVHAALQGDVLEAAIVEDEAPAPVRSPTPFARLALKRVAVTADGVMAEPPPAAAPAPPPPPMNFVPTLEMPAVDAEELAAASVSAPEPAPLPTRAVRPRPLPPAVPPVLTPVKAPEASPPGPKVTAPARPKSKVGPAAARPAPADEWAVRPVASAIPRGAPRPVDPPAPPVLDPFSTFPTEEVGGPREFRPAKGLPPLSALDADPEVSAALSEPEARPLPSKIAIEPAPLALTPPPPTGSRRQVVSNLELPAPTGVPRKKPVETLETPAHKPASAPAVTPLPEAFELAPLPSGRHRAVSTQVQFTPPPPPPFASREKHVSTQPDGRPFFEEKRKEQTGEQYVLAPKPFDLMETLRPDVISSDALGLEALSADAPPPEAVVTTPIEVRSIDAKTEPARKAVKTDPAWSDASHQPRRAPSRPKAAAVKREPEPVLTPSSETALAFPPLTDLPPPALNPFSTGDSAPVQPAPNIELPPPAVDPFSVDSVTAERPFDDPSLQEPAPAASPLDELASLHDAGLHDAGLPDAGLPDAGLPDAGLRVTLSAREEDAVRSSAAPEPDPFAPFDAAPPPPEPKEVDPFDAFPPVPPPASAPVPPPATTPFDRPRRGAPRSIRSTPPRSESLEFVPPAETAPRPNRRPAPPRPDSLEYVPPVAPPATPPGGAARAPLELEAASAATPPEGTKAVTTPEPPATPPRALERTVSAENLVSAAIVPPAELVPQEDVVAPPPADAVLTAAPLEQPAAPPEPLPPVLSPAPIDLAVSELPAWMRDAEPSAPDDALADPLSLALAAPGALERVVRLLIKRGALSEQELLEELKKQ